MAPDEDPQEWAQHLAICEQGYGPLDPHEKSLVCAIAAAMRNEIRADRMMAEVVARIPLASPGHSHGTDDQEPAHALTLGTAIRTRPRPAWRPSRRSGRSSPTARPSSTA
jgi:hypothetical protein